MQPFQIACRAQPFKLIWVYLYAEALQQTQGLTVGRVFRFQATYKRVAFFRQIAAVVYAVRDYDGAVSSGIS